MGALGGWRPDLGDFGHDGLVIARNVIPGLNGRKEPVGAPSAFSAALPAAWKGGGYFSHATAGTTYTALLAGTAAGLYLLDASAATAKHTAALAGNWWFFEQFGNTVIAVNGGAPAKYTLSTGLGAALGGSPPQAAFVAVVKDMVALAGGGNAPSNVVYNSALNNSEGWTIGTNQADSTEIPDGGAITGLAGGETLRVFQDSAINVMDYTGGEDIFIRRKVSSSIGALCQGGIATLGGVDYFWHRSGFHRLVPGAEPEPIGFGKVDQAFRSTYSDAEVQTKLRCAVDPVRQIIVWSMPGAAWIYHTVTGEWGTISYADLSAVTLGATPGYTLEQIAVTNPSIEGVTPSLDDPYWQGGYPILLMAHSGDFKLYSFSGSNMAASITLPKMELFPGRETILRNARIDGDVVSGVAVSIARSARLGDAQTAVSAANMRTNGDTPIRARGRYLQPTISTDAGAVWGYIQGLALEGAPGGRQ